MLPSASVTLSRPPRIALAVVTIVLAAALMLLIVRDGPLGANHQARPAACEIRELSQTTPNCP
jgi:hypothetical protein